MRPAGYTRRTFIRAAGSLFGAAAGLGLYTWRIEPHWLQFVRRRLSIRGLPRDLVGRTLVHISDVHVGPRVDDDYVVSAFRQASALQPDLVVFTGDVISYHPPARPNTSVAGSQSQPRHRGSAR